MMARGCFTVRGNTCACLSWIGLPEWREFEICYRGKRLIVEGETLIVYGKRGKEGKDGKTNTGG